jgi:hypothetical protein
MLIDGLIEGLDIALDDEADDDRRRYYRLTAKRNGGRFRRRRQGYRRSEVQTSGWASRDTALGEAEIPRHVKWDQAR